MYKKSGAMNTTGVERLVRDVIVHLGLPFTLLAVIESSVGWNVQVRAATGGLVSFALPSGRPVAMRIAIQDHLEAHD
jgi:hypothetical protein